MDELSRGSESRVQHLAAVLSTLSPTNRRPFIRPLIALMERLATDAHQRTDRGINLDVV